MSLSYSRTENFSLCPAKLKMLEVRFASLRGDSYPFRLLSFSTHPSTLIFLCRFATFSRNFSVQTFSPFFRQDPPPSRLLFLSISRFTSLPTLAYLSFFLFNLNEINWSTARWPPCEISLVSCKYDITKVMEVKRKWPGNFPVPLGNILWKFPILFS